MNNHQNCDNVVSPFFLYYIILFYIYIYIFVFFKLENYINPSLNALSLQVSMIFVTGQTMSSPAFQFMWPSVILRFNLQLCFSFINFNITFINFHSSLYQSLFFSAHTHTHTHTYIYIYEITS